MEAIEKTVGTAEAANERISVNELIVDELRAVMDRKEDERGHEEALKVKLDFIKALKDAGITTQKELDDTRLYHLITGSTPDPKRPPAQFDIADRRLEDFIRETL